MSTVWHRVVPVDSSNFRKFLVFDSKWNINSSNSTLENWVSDVDTLAEIKSLSSLRCSLCISHWLRRTQSFGSPDSLMLSEESAWSFRINALVVWIYLLFVGLFLPWLAEFWVRYVVRLWELCRLELFLSISKEMSHYLTMEFEGYPSVKDVRAR